MKSIGSQGEPDAEHHRPIDAIAESAPERSQSAFLLLPKAKNVFGAFRHRLDVFAVSMGSPVSMLAELPQGVDLALVELICQSERHEAWG